MSDEDVLPSDDVLRERVEKLLAWADDNDPDADGHEAARNEADYMLGLANRYEGSREFHRQSYVDGFEMCMCYIHDMLYGRE